MTYRSPTIQNELVECCGEVIQDTILKEVKEVPFYSVLMDEACDCSNTEQAAIVLLFVDSHFQV